MKATERQKAQMRAYYLANRDLLKRKSREYHEANKAKRKADHALWKSNNTEKVRDGMRKWREKNRDKYRDYLRKWNDKPENKAKKYSLLEYHKKYFSDLAYRLRRRFRAGVSRIVEFNGKRSAASVDYLGCSIETARAHIESLWLPGMSWDNHSVRGWHIDHKRPLASFDLTNPREVAVALHYTNLQPLWAKDNLSKGARAA